MRISFRLDDIAPDMDRGRFDRCLTALAAKGAWPLLGVIPENRDPKVGVDAADPAFWERMRGLRAEGCVFAVHGLHHLYDTKKGGLFPLNRQSEFAGHSYEEQRAKLEKGRQILEKEGLFMGLFMAPAHSYDKETLRALKDAGYTAVTDGFGTRPYLRDSLTFYPISADRKRTLKATAKEGSVTLVLHPGQMTDGDFAALDAILKTQTVEPFGDCLMRRGTKRSWFANAAEFLAADMKRRIMTLRRTLRG